MAQFFLVLYKKKSTYEILSNNIDGCKGLIPLIYQLFLNVDFIIEILRVSTHVNITNDTHVNILILWLIKKLLEH